MIGLAVISMCVIFFGVIAAMVQDSEKEARRKIYRESLNQARLLW